MTRTMYKTRQTCLRYTYIRGSSFYFYQILTVFNQLKIMSEIAHYNWKRLKLFTVLHITKNMQFFSALYMYFKIQTIRMNMKYTLL